MSKDLVAIAFAVMLVVFGSPALAQFRGAGLPPAIASAGVSQSEWDEIAAEARRQARRVGVAEAALLTAAERAGANLARSGQFDAAALREAIINQLEFQAQTIRELLGRLAILERADDPEIARLLSEARIAINEGRLDDADDMLAQAEESDLAAVAVAEARAERARERAAAAIAERGRLGRIQGVAAANVRDSIASYERALRGIDRTMAPRDWTRTQFNLGIAYAILAQYGDDEARVLAIAALQQATSGFRGLQDEKGISRAEQLVVALQAN